MKYYVVSPNVYKDGIDKYLSEMKDRHIAIMGWSKGDSKFGDMFARLKINDRIIIAHGANKNKRVYYVGIVASLPLPYNTYGESQYVELYKFKDIRSFKIPFSEKNTYGASNLIPSIYRLKKGVDTNIIDTIEQILSSNAFNIMDLAFWAKDTDRYISIPALQRGLVWKPKQVELLWDSILRGFPIGSFMLSEKQKADDYLHEKPETESLYYLIDGQQRFNAIALGYNAYNETNMSSIVWFDLCPMPNINSTRKFWIKLTTKSHPWGYKNNDDCSPLSASERRQALSEYGLNINIYNTDFNLKQTYPKEAKKPIPLYWLLNAPTMDEDAFSSYVLNKFDSNKKSKEYKLPFDDIDEQTIRQFYKFFHRLKHYNITTNLLEAKVLEDETETENTDISDIEVLFNRIGAGGTSITENELLYSAIKAYWPKEVKQINDQLASLYMPPVTLIMIVFRLSLTTQEDDFFKGAPSIKKIRQIAKEKGDQYNTIINFYHYEAENLLRVVNKWLTLGDAPTIIRTNIARKCPDLYLLLVYIAKKSIIKNEEDEVFIQALAFYIYWFGKDKYSKCVNTIFCNIKNAESDNFKTKIAESLLCLIQQQLLGVFYGPNYISSVFSRIGMDPDWRPYKNNNSSKPWWPLWNTICYNKELLLYAQRKYLKDQFSLYDPAKIDMWDEHNRPWDYDHIIPQDWIHQKGEWRKEYTEYCEAWLNCNGNFAAIPFEKNRGKSNNADWEEYINHKDLLLCDDEIHIFNQLFDKNIQSDNEQAYRFAVKTKERTIRIYRECYHLLNKVFENGVFGYIDSNNTIAKRKEILETIRSILGYRARVFLTFNGEEFEITNEIEWAMPELTLGITNGEKMVCLYYKYNQGLKHIYRIGIAKAPNFPKNHKLQLRPFKDGYEILHDDEWWYLYKDFCSDFSIDDIVKELSELSEYLNNC